MRRSIGKLAVALLLSGVCAGPLAASAGAEIAYGPCANTNDFACGHLTVPLDPSGRTPGTITLALRRHRAAVGEARDAVVALAGGPGQSAIPFAETFDEVLGPILSTRDLIVLDQRGTGFSHPLSCHALERPGAFHSIGQLVTTCASEIGPSRAFFSTAASVADIEAVRRAGGYEKLVLYGTSYGTKVAEDYAQAYPTHVEALVLDSVVPPNGPDPFDRATFAAVPRILRQICAARMCADITADPVADLARLVRRIGPGAAAGRVIDGHGRPHPVHIPSNALLGILVEGDLDPLLRAEFIPAVRAAADGDDAALARLYARATSGGEGPGGEDFDTPLNLATSCEDEAFPWSRSASPQTRIAQARAQIDALPATATAPFTAANMLALSDVPTCAYWPFSAPAAPVDEAPLPNVPTLILSGADDLRTPTANAREVAAQIPDSQLLVVPYAGHSVLTDEPTPCAVKALRGVFAGHPLASCPPTPLPPILQPPPLPPRRLADVPATKGYPGRPGRTLDAVGLTLRDFSRQLDLQLLQVLSAPRGLIRLTSLRSGGLRAGWAQYTGRAIAFSGYSYVPGVTISGTLTPTRVDLRVGGPSAARGVLRLGSHHALVGALGGRRIHVASTVLATAARASALDAGGFGWAPSTAAARALARLAQALARLGIPLVPPTG